MSNGKPGWRQIASHDNEAWVIARGVIEHEDGLINQRFTWLMVLNGFLFASFGGGVSLFEKVHSKLHLTLLGLGLLTLAVLGITSAMIASNLINVAQLGFRKGFGLSGGQIHAVFQDLQRTRDISRIPRVAVNRGVQCGPT